MLGVVLWMQFTNSYKKIEKIIIAFVSVIGISFIFELALVDIDWGAAAVGWLTPSIPAGSMPIIMSVLGAVVMPHNLFLHSEIYPKPPVELKRRESDEAAAEIRIWRYAVFYDRGMGDQQRDDPDGGGNLFSDGNAGRRTGTGAGAS